MIKFENAFSAYLHNKNYFNEVDLNEVNFKDLVTNINSYLLVTVLLWMIVCYKVNVIE